MSRCATFHIVSRPMITLACPLTFSQKYGCLCCCRACSAIFLFEQVIVTTSGALHLDAIRAAGAHASTRKWCTQNPAYLRKCVRKQIHARTHSMHPSSSHGPRRMCEIAIVRESARAPMISLHCTRYGQTPHRTVCKTLNVHSHICINMHDVYKRVYIVMYMYIYCVNCFNAFSQTRRTTTSNTQRRCSFAPTF